MRQRIGTLLALSLGTMAFWACGGEEAKPSRLELTVLPLELPDVGIATYDLLVEYDDPDTGWTTVTTVTGIESIQGGGASYVGPCVPGPSRVTLTVTALNDPGGQPMDVVLPPPIGEDFTCVENADTFVQLDVFVALAASQGFLDLSVEFEDLFCSAKVDCASALLQHPTTGERGPTLVTGLACTGGADSAPEDNYVGFVDAVLCCDDGVTAECTFLGQDPANAGVLYTQTYEGVEAIAGKRYVNSAWRLDDAYLASHTATCTFSALGFVNSDPGGNPGTTYVEGQPAVHFFADVLSDGTCGPTSAVTITYSADGEQRADCPDLPDGSPVGPFETEVCNGADDDCDGLIDEDLVGCDPPDDDGDGITNALDNCPGLGGPADGTNPEYNPGQEDLDGDGVGDVCDPDIDGDGILNGSDNCPTAYNPGQEDSDLDGFGDACDVGGQVCGDGNLQAPEQCDEGAANSDAPNATCRTDCTLARCGDGIVDDATEVCDDGNPFDGDGCDTDCQTTAPLAGATLPYYENFDSSTTQMLLLAPAEAPWWAPGTPSWRLSTAGDLGPDPHPRYLYDAAANGFATPLVSPLLDATGFTQITWQFRAALLPNGDGASVGFKAEISSDAGATWQTLYSRGSTTTLPPSIVTLDVSSYIANEPDAQVRYVVTGGAASDVLYVDVDDVTIAAGHAPSLGSVADAFVTYDSTQFLGVTATDVDTAGADLSFGLIAPSFMTLTDNGNGTASIAVTATVDDVGTYSATVSVTDGLFVDEATFNVTVTPPSEGPGDPVSFIIVRTAPGGGGDPLTADSPEDFLQVGDTRTFYAAGYNANSEFVADANVMWHAGGSHPSNVAGPASSYTFVAEVAGSGPVYATHPDPAVIDGQTGVLTVAPPPIGLPDVNTSALSATPAIVIANGSDTSTITVTLKDANGAIVTDPYAVEILATPDTLQGSVVNNGNGTYTQDLLAPTAPGTATVSARVFVSGAWATITQTAQVEFRTLDNVTGLVIDCTNYATYQGTDLLVEGGTLTINSAGCAPMEFGDVVLKDDSGECILTHAAATATSWEKIDIIVNSLRIEPGCKIDVTAKGYLGGNGALHPNAYTHGNLPDGPSGNSGGSYGGLGANGGFLVYGDLKNPVEPGAGGGRYNTTTSETYRGGAGGGLVRVATAPGGFVVVDGQILARGEDRTAVRGSGGSGGGIFIDTASLQGAGAIRADGGPGRTYSNYGYGGSGGRVSVVGLESTSPTFSASQLIGSITAYGGTGVGNDGGAGTVYIEYPGEVDGRLYIANADMPSNSGSTPLLCMPEGVIDLNPPPDAGGFYDVDANLRPGLYTSTLVNPNVAQTTSPAFADHQLFTVTGNTADRVDLTGAVPLTDVAASGDTYRGVVKVGRLIVADGGHLDARGCDLWISAGGADSTTVLDIDGEVIVGRADIGPIDTINVTGVGLVVTDALIGAASESFRFDLVLNGGSSSLPTVFLRELTATNGALLTAASLDVLLDAEINTGADVTISDSLFRVGGALTVTGTGSSLTHTATGEGPTERALRIEANILNVTSGGVIDVTGRGWAGGSGTDYLGHAPLESLRATGYCGGSHGGWGGRCHSEVYDSLYHPIHNGGGGGARNSASYPGGNGGGSIEIIATTSANLDGAIRANGAVNHTYGAGGAGGSIYVEAPTISGAGPLEAYGASVNTSYSGSGGGGRIALVAATAINGPLGGAAPWTAFKIYTGEGNGTDGGSGTFFRKVGSAYGDLVFDNNGQDTWDGSTPFVFQGLSGVTAVDATTLTDSGTTFDTYGELDGYRINPKVGQGTASLGDDTTFEITATATNTLTLDGDASALATPAVDSWSAYYRFDNVEVRGNARVVADAEVRIESGDIATGDDTTFLVDGRFDVRTLDLNGATILGTSSTLGSLQLDTLIQGDDTAYPFDIVLNGGSYTKDVVDAGSISATGATLTAGTVHVTGIATFATGSVVNINSDLIAVDDTLNITGAGSKITHIATGEGPTEHKLRIETGALNVTSGGVIDVSGRGWAGGASSDYLGHAPLATLRAPSYCGGTHAGWGGRCHSHVYDSLYHPRHNGGGGGSYNSTSYPGGYGGGTIEIIATTSANLDGAIRANGAVNHSYGGGGAGGSIYVEAPTISGVGPLEAYGASVNTSYSGGGGGGMIALVAATAINGDLGGNAPWSVVKIYAGEGYGTDGGSGTFYRKVGAAYGDLLFDNNNQDTWDGSTPLVFQGINGVTSVTADAITDSGTTFNTYGELDDYWVNPKVGQGTVSLGDDTTFVVTGTAANTLTVNGDPTGVTTPAVDSWSAFYRFDNVEVRGNARVFADAEFRIESGDIASADTTSFVVNGRFDVRTLDLNSVTDIGTGSGSSSFEVDTLIQGTNTDYPFDLVLNSGSYIKDVINANSILATGATVTAGEVHVTGDATFQTGSVLTITNDLLEVGGTLNITGTGSKLTHAATGEGPTERKLHVEVGTVNVTSGGVIDVSGRGWAGGSGGDYLGHAPADSLRAPSYCGGTHAGWGGRCHSHVYDSLYHPRHNGAGGGSYNSSSYPGGYGGGTIELIATTSANLDGAVRANGAVNHSYGGGGAGGSIYIEAPIISGVGPLEAYGASVNTSYSGGGGGGMIALVASTVINGDLGGGTPWSVVKVYAGEGYGTDGGSGTFYRKVGSAYGDLMFDNNGQDTWDGSTPLVFQGLNGVSAVSSTSLTDSASTFTTYGELDGYTINPKVGQGTASLGDDTTFTITATGTNTLTLDGDPTGVTTPAVDSWSAFYRFDNVEVRGNARVYADAEFRIESGDLASADATTFNLDGRFDVRTLDLNSATTIGNRTANGALNVETLVQGTDTAYPFDIVLNGGTYAKAVIDAGSLTAIGATVTGGVVHVAGDVSLQGGSVLTVQEDLLDVAGTLVVTGTNTKVTHLATGEGPTERKLRIEVDTLNVTSGGVIDVSGRGWAGGSGGDYVGHAPADSLRAPNYCGGTHAGWGGRCHSHVYDSLYHPRHNGGGGGSYNSSSYPGGYGGGTIEIIAATSANLDGAIRANGAVNHSYGGGGAGGSIYIEAPTISGVGPLEAYGASVNTGYSGGGGGGMIALAATTAINGALGGNAPWDVVKIYAGEGYGTDGGSGTFYRKVGAAYGDLLFDNNNQDTWDGSTPLVFQGTNGVTGVSASSLTDSASTFTAYGELDDYLINPRVGQGTASLGDDTVFTITATGTNTLTLDGDPTGVTTPAVDSWSAFYRFDNVQIRGNARVAADAEMRIESGDIASADATSFVVDGRLDVRTLDLNGVTTLGTSSAFGSFVLNTLVQGTDTAYPFALVLNGGGFVKPALDAASITATGTTITASTVDVTGSVDLQSSSALTADVVHVAGDASIQSGSVVTLNDNLLAVDGTLTVTGTGTKVTHIATGEGPTEHKLRIEVGTLNVTSGGVIDVSGRGWAGGSGGDYVGHALLPSLRAPNQCGGSHGGLGGRCAAWVFDSLYHPTHNGGGGGSWGSSSYPGGAGGGSIEIIAAASANLDGAIKANGAVGHSYGGGGAGGAIYVQAPNISGVGPLEAYGATTHTSYGGGGAGGMISLVASTAITGPLGGATPWDTVKIYPGNGGGSEGGSGTFYRKVGGAYGDLLFDSNNLASYAGSTPLVFQGLSTVTAVDATSITDGSATFDAYGDLDDYWINPKVGQGTASLGDDTVFTITGTGTNTVTVGGDPSAVTTPAVDSWSAFYRFDNVEVRGRAQVVADAEVRIESGDLHSNDTTSFLLDGRFDIRTLDLNNVTLIGNSTAYGSLAVDTLVQGTDTEYPFAMVLNGGAYSADVIHASSLTTTGATVTAGTIHVTGDATIGVGSVVTISNGLFAVDGTLNVTGAGTKLLHPTTGEGPTEYKLRLEVGTINLTSGAVIDLNGRGWAGGSGGDYVGHAPLASLRAPNQCGGSHGGLGGRCHAWVYDSLYHPIHNGAGGGSWGSSSYPGGYGGGSVEIIATASANLDGAIMANGAVGHSYGGGGAGGSIYVQASTISGAGPLEVYGATTHTSYGGGGAGGMIALVASTAISGTLGGVAPWTAVKIYPGNGGSTEGGSGTFFRRVGGANGDLLLDNNGLTPFLGATPLVFQGTTSTITSIDATSLTDGATIFDQYGAMDDYLINPDVSQNATPTLDDEAVFTITATSNNTVTLDADPTGVGAATEVWGAYYVFDNLEVRGRASLQADAQVLVYEGDISSGDLVTLSLDDSDIDIEVFDIWNVSSVPLLNGATLTTGTLIGGGNPGAVLGSPP